MLAASHWHSIGFRASRLHDGGIRLGQAARSKNLQGRLKNSTWAWVRRSPFTAAHVTCVYQSRSICGHGPWRGRIRPSAVAHTFPREHTLIKTLDILYNPIIYNDLVWDLAHEGTDSPVPPGEIPFKKQARQAVVGLNVHDGSRPLLLLRSNRRAIPPQFVDHLLGLTE